MKKHYCVFATVIFLISLYVATLGATLALAQTTTPPSFTRSSEGNRAEVIRELEKKLPPGETLEGLLLPGQSLENVPLEELRNAVEAIQTPMPQEKRPKQINWLGFGILLASLLTGVVSGVALFLRKNPNLKNKILSSFLVKVAQGSTNRDQTRRRHLATLQTALSGFYKLKNRYPTPEEFLQLKEKMDPPIRDPKKGKPTGFNDQSFDYYYSQTPEGVSTPHSGYYRLWGYLEGTCTKLELTSKDTPVPVPQSPVLETAPILQPQAQQVQKIIITTSSQVNTFLIYIALALILFNLGLTLAFVFSLHQLTALFSFLDNLLRQIQS